MTLGYVHLSLVKQCEFAVCSLPYHRPYSFQAATKLLEYLALGMKVICNPAPSNKMVCDDLNAADVYISSCNIFDQGGFEVNLKDISAGQSKYTNLGWGSVIVQSGVENILLLCSYMFKKVFFYE